MSEFRKYTREELVTFVRSMDRVIEEPTEISSRSSSCPAVTASR